MRRSPPSDDPGRRPGQATTSRPAARSLPTTEQLHQQFEQLRADYARRLADKLADIGDALASARDATGGAEAFVGARRQCHKLRGTAGTYGFSEVGTAAGHIEDAIRSMAGTDDASATLWHTIDENYQLLRQEVSRVQADLRPQAGLQRLDTGPLAPGDDSAGVSPTQSGSTILLVCDDAAFVQQFEKAAKSGLVQTIVTTSGRQAARIIARRSVDAAVIDAVIGQQGQQGVDVARRLRTKHGRHALPIALVSADGALQARITATHAGAELFLTQPVSDQELVDAIRQLVGQHAAKKPRVLLVDDDAEFCAWVSAVLDADQLDVHTLIDPTSIVEVLDDMRPDLLLLDMLLPGVNGVELCKMVRADPKWQMLPVVMLTCFASEKARVAAFESGADDYLLKPVVKQELLVRIRMRLEHARLVRERSSRDALTGLMTRRAFVEAFSVRLGEAERHADVLSLCLFDLDRFKQINDTHGHLAGDRVLASLGNALSSRFRDCDLRGRWGGEEFIVALPGVTAPAAADAVLRLQDAMRQSAFINDGGQPFHATFSAGVSTYPSDGTTLERLLRTADQRLYAAKRHGRDRVHHEDSAA